MKKTKREMKGTSFKAEDLFRVVHLDNFEIASRATDAQAHHAAYTRDEADGATPNGTLVEKVRSVKGDSHQDGDQGIILGSIYAKEEGYGYFVEWDDQPGVPVFIAAARIRRV